CSCDKLYLYSFPTRRSSDLIKNKFTIKNRGFSVNDKENSFYSQFDINDCFYIPHKSFVSSFRATTKKYSFQQMGHLVNDVYEIKDRKSTRLNSSHVKISYAV